jgi:eight-cysteine-cluster-containing protein
MALPARAAPLARPSAPRLPRWAPALLLALGACGHVERAEPTAPPPVAAAPTGGPAAAPARALPAPKEALYADCRERVELPEQDGECTTDADCARSGCSQELCVAAAGAAGIMSTCEVLPCFQVLGACGCAAGRCAWTLADPPAGSAPPPIQLPPKG